ncbi:hypothetical protein [Aureimonas jatrophae]|uniref:Uncharacterized protein n=1 Tax=Aureimonas jatrophae TaxID=1166073 RepID=A0A1H0MK79_9HYPH|nr:hypothetical protein [Aureimonas jatrophae]MBB3952927.1 hypothetical protein [Aureimonas jatrophae]SDO80560.1 hypothetical protein SAMN05192530_11429 [Aureimonas jatrophae]
MEPDRQDAGGSAHVTEHATRLYAIIARDAPVAVVFRRGPSDHVQMLRWDLSSDTVVPGQWFAGRIYERRCDLSPSGKLLVYLAFKQPSQFGAWSAVSRPPYFTALALWPKTSGTWGGGGLFETETRIRLNHRPDEAVLANGFALGKGMVVEPFGVDAGSGEDEPIWGERRRRDGWTLAQGGHAMRQRERNGGYWRIDPPRVWRKRSRSRCWLEEHLHGIARPNGSWYELTFRVLDGAGEPLFELREANWADWHGSDLLFGRHGQLFRLRGSNMRRFADRGEEALKRVADLSDQRFRTVVAPARARRW